MVQAYAKTGCYVAPLKDLITGVVFFLVATWKITN